MKPIDDYSKQCYEKGCRDTKKELEYYKEKYEQLLDSIEANNCKKDIHWCNECNCHHAMVDRLKQLIKEREEASFKDLKFWLIINGWTIIDRLEYENLKKTNKHITGRLGNYIFLKLNKSNEEIRREKGK